MDEQRLLQQRDSLVVWLDEELRNLVTNYSALEQAVEHGRKHEEYLLNRMLVRFDEQLNRLAARAVRICNVRDQILEMDLADLEQFLAKSKNLKSVPERCKRPVFVS
jgi:hypothetical protein